MGKPDLKVLLEGVADGNRADFRALYEATNGKLFGVAVRILKRRELAEEVVHDTFLRIWDGATDYRAELGSPLGWMVSITRNRSIDVLRKRTEVHSEDAGVKDERADDAPDPFRAAASSQGLKALLNCMSHLEPDHMRCLLMAYYEGYTHEEIAERLCAPIGTIKSRIRRGLARVRECLDDE